MYHEAPMGFGDLEVWVWGSVILALDTGECAWMAPGWYGKHGSAFCVFGLHLGFYCSFWKVLKWSEWLFLAWAFCVPFLLPDLAGDHLSARELGKQHHSTSPILSRYIMCFPS